jgi:hypothetical protein
LPAATMKNPRTALALFFLSVLTLIQTAKADDNPQVGALSIGECQETVWLGQPAKVCLDSQGKYNIVPSDQSSRPNTAINATSLGPQFDTTLNGFEAELSAIHVTDPSTPTRIRDLSTRVQSYQYLLLKENQCVSTPGRVETPRGPVWVSDVSDPRVCLNELNRERREVEELEARIKQKAALIDQNTAQEHRKVAEAAAREAREQQERQEQKEHEAEAQSPLLRQINSEYPGLADRLIGGIGLFGLPDYILKLSKLMLCMEHNKDAAEWNVDRDRGGVHVSGLLYQQGVPPC